MHASVCCPPSSSETALGASLQAGARRRSFALLVGSLSTTKCRLGAGGGMGWAQPKDGDTGGNELSSRMNEHKRHIIVLERCEKL
mmetsp:Transcript_27193/g.40043  ORF Transcript_27193/g.40043 Transcript_27193/m.40043 type:complete len:85 (-) Transcript_27193:11-265(-)